jgi:hypothetical protein
MAEVRVGRNSLAGRSSRIDQTGVVDNWCKSAAVIQHCHEKPIMLKTLAPVAPSIQTERGHFPLASHLP